MRYSEYGKGWDHILAHLIEEAERRIRKSSAEYPYFSNLRFYTDESDPEFEELVEVAEKKCATTCEVCGKPGQKIRSIRGWLTTRCDECEAKRVKYL